MPPETPSIKKSKDKPPSNPPIKVVITEGCVQKEPQKDKVDASKPQETELSLKPGSPLVMTHHISLVPGSCTGGCEAEMTALKDRVAILEKEMSALKKKCTHCSGSQCPNNCNKNGKCVSAKCVCQTGFTGADCSRVANKEKVSSESTAKQEPLTQEQSKANTTISTKKESEESHSNQARGSVTVQKISSHKDLPLNHNVTQSIGTKYNRTLKGLIKLTKATESIKTSSEKGKTSLSDVTSAENDKKPSLDNIIPKGGESVVKKEEKPTNATEKLKGKKDINESSAGSAEGSAEKKWPGKQSNITTSNEKAKKPGLDSVKEGSDVKKLVEIKIHGTSIEKKPSQGNVTKLKEGSSDKKQVEQYSVSPAIKNEGKLGQSNNLPKEGSSGKRKVGTGVDKTFVPDDETKAKHKATSGNKKGETHVNVTAFTVKEKKLNQGNVTPLKETSVEKTKVDKHQNVTNSTQKDRKNQSSVTQPKEKISEMRNITNSSEKRKKLVSGIETNVLKDTLGRKTPQRHLNTTTSYVKDNKHHRGNVTDLKEELPRTPKLDRTTTSTEKDKNVLQTNKTKVTTFTEKDTKHHKSNSTLIKGPSPKGKVDHINVKKSNEKGNQFLQGDETTVQQTGEKDVNATTTSEKDDSLHHSLKEDASRKNKVNSDLKNITISKTHVNQTTKLKDIGPVEVHNITATGFVITWKPQGSFKNFTVTRREVWSGRSNEDDAEEAEKSQGGEIKADEVYSSNGTSSKVYSGKADGRSAEKFSQILAGSARSYHFKSLRPQRKYAVSLFGSGPHERSKVHRLIVSTGPEAPTELLFSNITETSLTVFWTKPKSTVTGFKVTYTNSASGVTGSMFVDSQLSHVLISKLSVGSRYEINVRSVMGALESEATTASVVTVPDSPADLQALDVTDSKALLTWKHAQAKVDYYILSYGSTRSPNVTVTVMLSGTSVAHQLRGLHRSTLYSVKIMSQINSLQSSSVSTTFTTKSGIKLQVVTPGEVTWNSALISWKIPHLSFKSYRLTYQGGEEKTEKEVILNPTVSHYKLTDLVASSYYTVKVDGESDGQYIRVVSTSFTTAHLPYPYPAECSQVQLNGMKESGEAEIYPEGKDGKLVSVYCDMETDGGGWTVFQRRFDGSTDFFREWKDYSKGFGEISANFWLGNDILHDLTTMEPMSLRVDLRLGNDTAYAHYSNFSVGSEVNHYALDLSGYSGTAGDSMRYHNGCPFSTKDLGSGTNSTTCANNYLGGWWYKNCYKANLNGHYATFSKDQGVVWIDWKGKDISLSFTEMKLRPASLSHRNLHSHEDVKRGLQSKATVSKPLHGLSLLAPSLPGPPSLPFLGNMLELSQDHLPLYLTELAHRYGSIYRLHCGSTTMVILNSSEVIREALVKKWSDFAGRPQSYTADKVSGGNYSISLGDFSKEWKSHRRLVHSALQHCVVESLHCLIEEQALHLKQVLLDYNKKPVDLSEDFTVATSNIITMLAFGKSYEKNSAHLEEIHDCLNKIVALWGSPWISALDYFPLLRKLPNAPFACLMREVARRDELIGGHLDEFKRRKDREEGQDFAAPLLQYLHSPKGVQKMTLTDSHIHMTTVDLLIGGTETTAAWLSWTIAFLLHRPEVQTRVYVELNSVLKGQYPRYSDRHRLPYLSAVINEVLRMRPVAPLAVPHKAIRDSSIAGYFIPKNTIIIPNLFGAHHDPAIWVDPHSFRP
ncbi:tenascin-like, partial [Clarias magur]